ncbi:MAG: DUF3747 domain-containing protein [Cyanothece sp. SIO2G6]|nr:DUF3747 domain-containing protein [Cyanothece sp. SIO2G6]
MKYFNWSLNLALLATLGLAQVMTAPKAVASLFQQTELNQEDVIAIASPIGTTRHQLLILEQIGSQRECWAEQGDSVTPLLVDFDFTGICGRATDSNGYSIRVGNEDLGLQYTLRLAAENGTLRLLASSDKDRTAPPIEVGRATQRAGEFVSITLNPGWRITKRSYNGQELGHYYLSNDQSLTALQPEPEEPRNVLSVRPAPSSTPIPLTPGSSVTLPTIPVSGTPSPVRPSTPSVPSRAGYNYRVTVPATTVRVQNQIRELVPDAFRTLLNGQMVMQVGLFSNRQTAVNLQNQLRRDNFVASIQEVPESATPRPSTTANTRPSTPVSRRVIVLDPGHGGRDPGAVGRNNLYEKTVVNDITRKVADLLESQGMQVVLTRNQDSTLDLEPRVQIAERNNADLFVSIHANAISLSRPEVNGAETYFYSSASGRQLAGYIQRNLVATGMRDRGVREARFYVIRRTSMPSALVEVGFVTGAQDAPRLANASFRTELAEAIADGILNYVRAN